MLHKRTWEIKQINKEDNHPAAQSVEDESDVFVINSEDPQEFYLANEFFYIQDPSDFLILEF